MKEALRLARKGLGKTSPNPLVGAVIVKAGTIIGRGYHAVFGGDHAEIRALSSAAGRARGADLYVTLEPCCHHGKTPPCTQAIIKAGIRRVFIGMQDPNPAVCGRGIAQLSKAGISVECGMLEGNCRRLNESFITFITKQRPFVILKAAMTLDGTIATASGDSQWITAEQSRNLVHRLRASVDAVMVGSGTVITDNPRLTPRLQKRIAKTPFRVIADSRLRVPLDSRILQPDLAPTTIIATAPHNALTRKARRITATGARIISIPEKKGHIDIIKLLAMLAENNIASVLLEGGAELNSAALAARIVDKVMLFYAPKLAGGLRAKGMIGGSGPDTIAECLPVNNTTIKRIGTTDFLVQGYLDSR